MKLTSQSLYLVSRKYQCLLQLHHLAPFRTELPIFPTIFVREKLLLTHTVETLVLRLVNFPRILQRLQNLLHTALVLRIAGRRPSLIAELQLSSTARRTSR